MSRELLDKARHVIKGAEARGAQGVRAVISRNRDSRVEWLDGDLDRVRQSTTMSLDMSLYVDGRYSAHNTCDLRPEALDTFLDETIGMTRLLAEDTHRKLPDPARYADRFTGDLKIYDGPGAEALTGTDRRRAAEALEAAARSVKGADKIVSVSSRWSDNLYQTAMAVSNGMEGAEMGTSFVLVSDVTVRDEGDRKPRGFDYTVSLHRGSLEPIETIGAGATLRALEGIGEAPEKSGVYPCIVENRVAGRLIGGLFSPLSGRAIQQKRSFLADKMGEQITNPILTVIDDPHVVGGFGSSTFDSEGMATRKMPIFEKGVLKNFYLDTYYASKLEMVPTTSGRTNLVFKTGDRDLEALLAEMGTGILITGFMGGNSNSTTGDASIGVRGHFIENGRRVRPIAEMNLSGNHLEFWNHLIELGNDPYPYSSMRIPSLRFDEAQFSGV